MQIIATQTLYGFAKKLSHKSYYTWFFPCLRKFLVNWTFPVCLNIWQTLTKYLLIVRNRFYPHLSSVLPVKYLLNFNPEGLMSPTWKGTPLLLLLVLLRYKILAVVHILGWPSLLRLSIEGDTKEVWWWEFDHKITLLSRATFLVSKGNRISRAVGHQK